MTGGRGDVSSGDPGDVEGARSRGSTLRATLAYVVEACGEERAEAALARLPADVRSRVEAAGDTDELDFGVNLALWRAVDEEIGEEVPDWPERAGAYSIASSGQEHYGGILRKASPREFLTQPVSLFRLYYAPGDMEVVREEPGRVVLRLVGFDRAEPLFCRRQTGGLRRALELAGGEAASVRHVRCSHEGDAFCEWELLWNERS